MQPSAPPTTAWSTSATVPEQTSAWERAAGIRQAPGCREPTPRLPPPHKVATLAGAGPRTQISACAQNVRGQDTGARHARREPASTQLTPHPRCSCAPSTRTAHAAQGKPGTAPGWGRSQRPPGPGLARAAPPPSLGTGAAQPGPAPGTQPPSPAPSPGGRLRRRQTSWEPQQQLLVGDPSSLGARWPGHTGSPASCAGPPSGRTWARPSAGPPVLARFAT